MTWVAWIQLALIGLAIAATVIFLFLLKNKNINFSRLVWLTAFFTFDLILFGAFTRLTDSGLGCPDWPGCYGTSNPLAALTDIRAAEAAMPTGPVTLSKAWIEMLHRYFAMGVGVLIIAISIWAWVKRHVLGPRIMWTSLGILILVCVQGAFGAWTVTMKLQPIIVTIHLMLGLSLLASLVYLYTLSQLDQGSSWQMRETKVTYPSVWLVLAFIALIMQIFLGGWVSTNYAVLACEDFPLCHGQWVPVMDMKSGFQLWRELGLTKTGEVLALPALVAIHWVHRVMAIFVLSILFALAYKVYGYGKNTQSVRHQHLGLILAFLALLQLLTGMSNIILDWPLIAALMHTGGAAAILVVLVRLLPLSRRFS